MQELKDSFRESYVRPIEPKSKEVLHVMRDCKGINIVKQCGLLL